MTIPTTRTTTGKTADSTEYPTDQLRRAATSGGGTAGRSPEADSAMSTCIDAPPVGFSPLRLQLPVLSMCWRLRARAARGLLHGPADARSQAPLFRHGADGGLQHIGQG